ncbi:hypothetical protein V3331_00125 [Gaopeijia maritima]|uniref:hypothetical protein n=1 Tax=Gaopeijia maritima TaxID=3119007 RepID=UPI003254A843
MSRTPLHDHLVPDFTRMRTHRPVLAPLLLGWALAAITAWSIHPLLLDSAAADSDGARTVLTASLWILAAVAPLFSLLRAGVLSLVTWSVATLGGSHRSAREMLSIFLYGDCLYALAGLLLTLWFHVATAMPGAAPEPVDPLSLARIVPSDHVGWSAVIGMVSLTSVAWLVYTGFALRRVSRFGRPAVGGLLTAVAVAALVATYLKASLGAS